MIDVEVLRVITAKGAGDALLRRLYAYMGVNRLYIKRYMRESTINEFARY